MSGTNAVPTIPKPPQMRGLLNSHIKQTIIVGTVLGLIAGFTFKKLVADKRKERYAEFYRTYDAEKEFEIMREKGLFQSC